MMTTLKAALIAAIGAFAGASASAAVIDAPVPDSLIVDFGGDEWVWASYCSPTGCTGGSFGVLDLSFQGPLGWRIPTLDEITGAVNAVGGPSGWLSLFATANCAAQYFLADAGSRNTCDSADVTGGAIFNFDSAFLGNDNVETFLTRGGAVVIPVPAALPLMLTGLAAFGFLRRRA